jgi:hypothetical protein
MTSKHKNGSECKTLGAVFCFLPSDSQDRDSLHRPRPIFSAWGFAIKREDASHYNQAENFEVSQEYTMMLKRGYYHLDKIEHGF